MSQFMPSSYPSAQLKPQVSPLSPASFLTRLTGSVVLLNLFVITLVALSIHQSHRHYQERAEITTQNLTQTLESEIADTIKTDDVALFAVMEEYKKQRVGGVNEKVLNTYIERVRSRLPEIDALRITDSQGVLIYGNDVMPGTKTSLADRPHFVRLRDDPKAGLVISKPQVSRVNQKWVIVLARRINQPDGSFGGMAFAAITLEHLSKTFSVLNVGSHGAVTLRDSELGIVIRHPETERIGSVIGQRNAPPSLQEMVRAGLQSGTYQAQSTTDYIERMFSYRRVDGYPFFVTVGLATEDYLTAWRNEAAKQAALVALFALITFLAAWLIYRIWKRQVNLVEALTRQEAKFRTVADFTFHWEYWKGSKGEILYMTPSCERVTGYIREQFVADPGLLLRIIHPDDRHVMDQHLHDIVSQAYQDGMPVDFRIVRRNGDIRWISHHCRIISGRNGESMGRRVSNRDVTERKLAEIIVERERTRLQTILKTAIDGIHITDYDGVLVEANEAFLNMLGLDHSAIGKLRITDWDVQSSWTDIKARIDEMIAHGSKVVFESRFRRSDGVVLDAETNASGIEIEGKGYIYAASRDITERKRVEDALREKEERLALATIHNGVGIWDWNLQTQEMIWDDSMYALYHIRREDFLGTEEAWRATLHPDDLARGDKEVEDAISGKKPFETEFRVLWPNGEIRYIKAVAKVFRDNQGMPLRMLGINMDITESRLVKKALFESQERFNLFMDTLPAAAFIKNAEGVYIYVNRYVANIFGERDWLGKSDRDIFPSELAEKIYTDDLRALEAGLVVTEDIVPSADGQPRLLEVRKFRIPRHGQPPILGGIALDFTEQRRNAEQYRSVIQASLDGYWVTDASGRILEANESICRMHGYSREELLRLSISDIEADETPEETAAHIREMIEKGHVQFEARHKRKDGSIANVEVSILHVATLGERFFAFIRDITERKKVEAELRIAATAFESQEGMVITDADNVILRVNRAYTEITGYMAEEAVGRNASLLKSGRHDSTFYAGMWEVIFHQGVWQGEIWNRRKNGEVYPEWLTITAVKGVTGEVTHYVGTLTDITLRKAAENEIKHLAFYDPLTRLPNRRLLLDRLQQALASSTRNRSEGALLFIDLDNFKTLNDTLGHDIGDLLLQQVAQRLATCIREGDTVARLGGDEFVVMLEDLSENPQESATQTETVCEKILAILNQPYMLAGHQHHSTPSIGATLFNDHQNSVDELLKRADLAMYQAKAAGRNTVRFYDPEMQAAVTAHATLEADMRQGLQQNEFLLYYQPQVDEKGWMTGAEALVRWQHPRRGLMPPTDFIPIAEETGLIMPLGHWVLETACAQLVAWAAQPDMAHLTMAVNVSARQFHRTDFVDHVLEVLDQTGADPQKLKLELTESLLLEDVEDIIAKMTDLKTKGVGFSLDDFGTGYSSLSYLKRLPLDQLKIDQSFVRDILTDSNDAAIARTIIALAQSMGLEVIAEGVETVEQRDFLASQSCHAFQGYLFGRPLPVKEFRLFQNLD